MNEPRSLGNAGVGMVDVLHIVQISSTRVMQLDKSVGDIAAGRILTVQVMKAWQREWRGFLVKSVRGISV